MPYSPQQGACPYWHHEYTTDAQDSVAPGTLAHIDALWSAYLRFAMDKKHGLMGLWNADERRAEAREVNWVSGATRSNRALLAKATSRVCRDVLQTATLLWSTAHGIATLQHNRLLDTFDQDADAEAMLRTATRAILNVKV